MPSDRDLVQQYPEELVELLKSAIRAACPGDDECLADEEECFRAHPIHDGATRDGVIESVYADVDGAVRIVLDALSSAGHLVPEGSEVQEEWGVRFRRSDGVVDDRSDASREAAEAWVAELQRQREHNQAPHGWAWTVDPSPIVRSRITTPWTPAESAQRTGEERP